MARAVVCTGSVDQRIGRLQAGIKKTPPEGGVQITASITGACCRPAPVLVAYY